MKKPFSIAELSLRILRISIGIAIAVSIIGYLIDISQTSTIVIQGIPQRSTAEADLSEAAPAQTTAASVAVSQPETTPNELSTDIPAETTYYSEITTPPPAITSAAPVTEQSTAVITNSSAQAQHNTTSSEDPIIPVSGFININTASAAELMELDGIGEVKAAAIVEYRREHGEFKSVDDLLNVKGIGEKTLEKNRYRITI